MEIIRNKNLKKLERIVVDVLVKNIRCMLKRKEYVVLGIVGGKSILGIFSLLKEEKRIAWGKVHIFMVDERLVDLDNEESNFKLARDFFINSLIENGLLPVENVHPFVLKDSEDFGVSEYEREFKKYGDSFDIVIFSSGEDGHIAALFPNHDSVRNDSEYFLFMEDAPKSPEKRMSASRKLILRSKVALILFLGEKKGEAYRNFLKGDDVFSCPARLVKKIEKSYVITNLD